MITAIQANAIDETNPMQETAQKATSSLMSTTINAENTTNNTINRCGVSFLLPSKSLNESGAKNGIGHGENVENKEHTWFVCYECNSRFLTQEILDEHSVMHTGILFSLFNLDSVENDSYSFFNLP